MPLSFSPYGATAMLVLVGIVIINEVVKHVKNGHAAAKK
jgi:hypothetical protein